MSVCAVCTGFGEGPICASCRGGLQRAAPVRLGGCVEVCAPYTHNGTARRLVHLLKYAGMHRAAEVLATAMLDAMPPDVAALVPVPRATLRKFRYGVDPAVLLARLIGKETGIPVVLALQPPIWWPANAGTSRAERRSPGFRALRAVPADSLLVDDVVTTGVTLVSAAATTMLGRAITATRAGDSVSG